MVKYDQGGIALKVSIKLNLDIEEEKIFNAYSKYTNVPLSVLLKDALMKKIEDELDLKTVMVYEQRIESNDIKLFSFDEASRLLSIQED
jgi:hypothetical protein